MFVNSIEEFLVFISGPSDKEQEETVKDTLVYLRQLPTQDVYQPPLPPVVTFDDCLEVKYQSFFSWYKVNVNPLFLHGLITAPPEVLK